MIIILLLVILIFGGAIGLAVLVVSHRKWAKREARKMVDLGWVSDEKKFKRVSKTLSSIANDHEAHKLWDALQDLPLGER